ncbi:MAG: histidine kinase [Clostridiales Family XIII bacterium]|jgi:signal transduction histidine kinase|nr:histidine kinase [Clostridiales Family XIII bacterium]
MTHGNHNQALVLYTSSVSAAAICFAMSASATTMRFEHGIVIVLSVAVLLSAALLLTMLNAPALARIACLIFSCAGVVIFAPQTAFPMVAATVLSIFAIRLRTVFLAIVVCAACAVYAVSVLLRGGAISILLRGGATGIYSWNDALLSAPDSPDPAQQLIVTSFIIAALITGFSLYILFLIDKHKNEIRQSDEKSDRIEELRDTIRNQSRSARTMEQISKLEERNRLAARIHDEVGHGMSGSILLLEGAIAIIDNNPDEARETVKRVTEHLRESTDKIRAVLREERTDSADMSLAKIQNELAAFESDHPSVRTKLRTDGDMEQVGRAIWTCIRDNMREAMTNTLKHSNATRFSVSIANSNKLLTVAFTDNGAEVARAATGGAKTARAAGGNAEAAQVAGSNPEYGGEYHSDMRRGIGRQNMEERCALCYGRCFFRKEADGFHVVMTFPLRT